MGVEIIAVTAGEAERPEVTIPRAMRNIVYRLIFFYVLAIAIMVTMVPWNQAGRSAGSPFVTAFAAAHVPFAAAIMNFVVLTAALSSVNTNLYLSTRMLFSLGRGGYAPAWMGRVSGNGVPHRALLASTAGIVAAILLAIYAPKNAFLMLYGTAVAGMLFVWLVILNTHLRFRKAITRERLAEFAHASSRPSLFYDTEHRPASGNISNNFFCGWPAMVDSRICCFPRRDLTDIPAPPKARALTTKDTKKHEGGVCI